MTTGIRIYDLEFGHSPSVSATQNPQRIRWLRDGPPTAVSFFTDRCLEQAPLVNCRTKVAWLIEPTTVPASQHERIIALSQHFDWVLSYNRELLWLGGDKFRFYPFGGCWIPPEKVGMHKKTRLVSMLASAKDGCFGYRLRHEAAKRFSDKMDVFGMVANRPVACKTEALGDYCFSVVIENAMMDDWFTEKIVDCFACGTIPFYWGTRYIGDHFDQSGILSFGDGKSIEDDVDQLGRCLDVLSPSLYERMRQFAELNLKRHFDYRCAEDWILRYHPDLIL